MDDLDRRIFFGIVLLLGLWPAIWPTHVIAFRRRFPMGEAWGSGGYFYATPFRARVSGLLFVLIGVAGVSL